MNKDFLARNCETKLIGNVPHMRVLCRGCKEFVWIQTTGSKKHQTKLYLCKTCTGDK